MTTPEETDHAAAERPGDSAELARVNEELRAAMRELQTHEEARRLFVDNASHELRTPLASMSYTIGNLLHNIAGPIPNRVRDYLEMLRDECQRMVGTVTRILDLSRIDAATIELHPMRIHLYRFVQTVVATMAPEAQRKDLRLTLLPSKAATGFVAVDPLRCENVLRSIVGNAIGFAPDNGNIDVSVEWVRDEAWIELSVTDDGPGISKEDLPRVTERYFRVGEFVKGTGLGLAFCKEIIELHGGELEVVSPPPGRSNGTRVSIRLPRAEPLRIAAIDDSQTIRMIIERQLTAKGYRVDLYSTAEAALQSFEETVPDMIIVDSIMPGMHGVDFISRIKAAHNMRAIPLLMLTGAELDRGARTVLESFAIPVLAKPWNADELLESIEGALHGKRYLQG